MSTIKNLQMLRDTIDKKSVSDMKDLELIVYSYKTKEDIEADLVPLFKRGYAGLQLAKTTYIQSIDFQLSEYIRRISDNHYNLEVFKGACILLPNDQHIKYARCGDLFIDYTLEDEYKESKEKYIVEMNNRMKTLEQKVTYLTQKLEEVYNSPGMPGMIEAMTSFEKARST